MNRRKILSVLAVLVCLLPLTAFGQRAGYSKEEFVRRRTALMDSVTEGMIILFGEASPQPGAHIRQDNDFYYFSGVEDLGAVLVMIPQGRQSHLFLPIQSEREIQFGGANLLRDKDFAAKTGLSSVQPSGMFDELLARRVGRDNILHVRLSPRDTIDNARSETRLFLARQNRLFYNAQISLDSHRINALKERYPDCRFKDITPFIDELRVIKSAEEIAVLRRNGRISAEAVRQAMLTGRPGAFEYEVEAAAMSVVLTHGARGFAYPPIVGSGPNSCVLHYEKNSRQIQDGEVILMDFGGELDYLCMDISRTWPANGTFTSEQREAYEVALEVLKACIEAYRPGVTNGDVQKHVAKKMAELGLDPRGQRGGIGHYVGMCVHDVGARGPLREGMVFAIEPGLYYPDKNLGIRIEDTILITKDGCEVLSRDVPKEIAEVEKLLASRK